MFPLQRSSLYIQSLFLVCVSRNAWFSIWVLSLLGRILLHCCPLKKRRPCRSQTCTTAFLTSESGFLRKTRFDIRNDLCSLHTFPAVKSYKTCEKRIKNTFSFRCCHHLDCLFRVRPVPFLCCCHSRHLFGRKHLALRGPRTTRVKKVLH